MPLLTGFFLLLGLASIGLPATNGFPVRLLLILGALEARTDTQPKAPPWRNGTPPEAVPQSSPHIRSRLA